MPWWENESSHSQSSEGFPTAKRLFIVGHDGAQYHGMLGGSVRVIQEQLASNLFETLLGKALRCHWTFARSPLTLVQVWCQARRVDTGQFKHNWFLFWTGPVLAAVRHAIDGGEFQLPAGELLHAEGQHIIVFENPCFLV